MGCYIEWRRTTQDTLKALRANEQIKFDMRRWQQPEMGHYGRNPIKLMRLIESVEHCLPLAMARASMEHLFNCGGVFQGKLFAPPFTLVYQTFGKRARESEKCCQQLAN